LRNSGIQELFSKSLNPSIPQLFIMTYRAQFPCVLPMQKISLHDLKNKKIGIVFSSAFFGFFAHAGCLKALEELGIKAAGYAGSSAGAIVAACAASGVDAASLARHLFTMQKSAFWDPEPRYRTVGAALRLFRGWRGRVRGEKLKALLDGLLPIRVFEELTTPCVITGTNLTEKRKEIISSGNIADAVIASLTVPWLFKLKQIGDNLFLDGGLADKAPVEALADRVAPEVIIVSYLYSEGLQDITGDFLSKRFTPHRAFILATSIARHEQYLTQKRLVEQRGIQVIELSPQAPLVHPDRLDKGVDAFDAAYSYTKSFFSG